MATVGAIQTRIEDITGRDDLSSRIQTRILGAIKEIQRRNNHYWSEESEDIDIVADQQTYVLADELMASYKDLINVWLLDSDGLWNTTPLKKYTMEEARHEWNADDEGDPEAYTLFKETIYVWPPKPQDATKDLRIEFYKYLTVLSFPSGTDTITADWDDLVEAWATWKLYKELPGEMSSEEAKRWEEIALGFYEQLQNFSNTKRMKDKTVMKVRTSPKEYRSQRNRRPFGGR